jgi:GDP-L-fucose synthase
VVAQKDARIYVAGHTGLIGSAVVRRLMAEGYRRPITCDRATLDLTDSVATDRFFDECRPEYVVLAAGRVGGIIENQRFPADFITTNLAIQLNVLRAAQRTGVRRLIFPASSCMYPRECPQPMAETALLSGKPEPTSLAYAMAKLAGVQMCLAYNQQDGEPRFIPIIPNSAYGPGDNFDLASGHVLASLVRRFVDAQAENAPTVTLWGSGRPRREFVFADDIADACLRLLMDNVSGLELPVNLGSGIDYSIAELAGKIATLVGYTGRIVWDSEKPDGAPQKLLDSSRLKNWGWQPVTRLEDGLRQTIDWYRQNSAKETTP